MTEMLLAIIVVILVMILSALIAILFKLEIIAGLINFIGDMISD